MPRAQARRSDRRDIAAEKGRHRWDATRARLETLCRPATWPPVAQAVGSVLLCGLIGGLIALAGAG